MIITAQPFFNELDLLELKCRELAGVVDAHVVVEATTTFTGIPKPLHFAANKERFAAFPIIHVMVDLPLNVPSPWEREGAQYRAVFEAVRKLDPELALWVDADEVPRRDTVERFRAMKTGTATLDMDHMLFFFDRIDTSQRWTNGKIGFFDRSAPHQPWRGQTHWPVLMNSGWHFEYFGRRDDLLAKLAAVSHAPEPGCQQMRFLVGQGQLPGLERTSSYPEALLPAWVREDPQRFAGQFFAREFFA